VGGGAADEPGVTEIVALLPAPRGTRGAWWLGEFGGVGGDGNFADGGDGGRRGRACRLVVGERLTWRLGGDGLPATRLSSRWRDGAGAAGAVDAAIMPCVPISMASGDGGVAVLGRGGFMVRRCGGPDGRGGRWWRRRWPSGSGSRGPVTWPMPLKTSGGAASWEFDLGVGDASGDVVRPSGDAAEPKRPIPIQWWRPSIFSVVGHGRRDVQERLQASEKVRKPVGAVLGRIGWWAT